MPLSHFLLLFLSLITLWGTARIKFNTMSDNFKILSLNINGNIKDSDARGRLLACVKLYNINIILLQETHVNSLNYKNKIDREFNCDSYWSFGASDSRGVAICVMKNFERDIIKFKRDFEGRVISVKVSFNLGVLNLVSAYSPNNISDRKN